MSLEIRLGTKARLDGVVDHNIKSSTQSKGAELTICTCNICYKLRERPRHNISRRVISISPQTSVAHLPSPKTRSEPLKRLLKAVVCYPESEYKSGVSILVFSSSYTVSLAKRYASSRPLGTLHSSPK